MANFYISDLHIGHENILRFDNRPFADVNEMNNKLIENWNARVRSDDTVYILGDFIWAKESEWPSIVGSLAGNKVLIRGNHDPKQFSAATKRMFQEITDLKEIKDSGKHVVMCHYPIPFFRAGFAPTAFMLYGHVHRTIEYEYIAKLRREVKANATGYGTPNGNFINVGCMMPYMDYTPRTLDEIIDCLLYTSDLVDLTIFKFDFSGSSRSIRLMGNIDFHIYLAPFFFHPYTS